MRRECRRGDLWERVERTRLCTREMAPVSLVWKQRPRGRLRILDKAQNVDDGVGRFRRRIAAIVWMSCKYMF